MISDRVEWKANPVGDLASEYAHFPAQTLQFPDLSVVPRQDSPKLQSGLEPLREIVSEPIGGLGQTLGTDVDRSAFLWFGVTAGPG